MYLIIFNNITTGGAPVQQLPCAASGYVSGSTPCGRRGRQRGSAVGRGGHQGGIGSATRQYGAVESGAAGVARHNGGGRLPWRRGRSQTGKISHIYAVFITFAPRTPLLPLARSAGGERKNRASSRRTATGERRMWKGKCGWLSFSLRHGG